MNITHANRIISMEAIHLVEQYLEAEFASIEKFDNRELLDDTGIWSLHTLANHIYALGFEDGERVAAERAGYARRRATERRLNMLSAGGDEGESA